MPVLLPNREAGAILSRLCCRLPEVRREEQAESRARLASGWPWTGLVKSEGRHGGEGLASGQRPNVAQRGLLLLGAQPVASSRLPPAPLLPPTPQTVTSKQTGPFILYSGGIKITTKTLQKGLRELMPPVPSATETPGRGDRGERKEGESWQCWHLRGPAGRLRRRGGAAGGWWALGSSGQRQSHGVLDLRPRV